MRIIQVLEQDVAARVLDAVRALPFGSGSSTALGSANSVKRNAQAIATHPDTLDLIGEMTRLLSASNEFVTTAFPRRYTRLTFSRYEVGDHYGDHLDLPLMGSPGSDWRTDMSFTLSLSDPWNYGGGELLLRTNVGTVSVALPAGTMVLYETNLHHSVTEVTSGVRYVLIGWVESHIGDNELRTLVSDAYALRSGLDKDSAAYAECDALAQRMLRYGAQR